MVNVSSGIDTFDAVRLCAATADEDADVAEDLDLVGGVFGAASEPEPNVKGAGAGGVVSVEDEPPVAAAEAELPDRF